MNIMRRLTELIFIGLALSANVCSASAYLSPECAAASPDGKTLYVTAATAGRLLVVDVASRKTIAEWPLPCNPSGVAVASDGDVYVTGGNEGTLYKFSSNGKLLEKVETGHSPVSPIIGQPIGQNAATVYVLNRFDNNVAVVDAAKMKVRAVVKVLREPFAAALGVQGRLLFVANHLPAGRDTDDVVAAAVSIVDTATCNVVRNVMLPNGGTDVCGVAASQDGRFVYVTHSLARYQFPTTQLEHGWTSTAALSVFNGETGDYVNTVLLDDVDLGAATPWGVAVSPDDKSLVVAHAGSHELSVINRKSLHARLDRAAKNQQVTEVTHSTQDVPNDLAFLTGIRRRVKLCGNGPRGVTIVGNRAYAAVYFSDLLAEVDLNDAALKSLAIPLGPTVDLSRAPARRGEMLWNDATMCFQHWLSCATCHPDGRSDGLTWDLMNDGLGNPKNTRSMLLGVQAGPTMALGVRKNMQAAVRSGIAHIEFMVRPKEDAEAIDAYIKSLRPTPSPYLVDGQMSSAAQRGKEIFFNPQVGCAQCHPAPTYSDGKSHNVGSSGQWDHPDDQFYTPSLLECWRTAPYMHDGRYRTIREVLIEGRHGGKNRHWTDQEIDDLAAFVLSL